MSLNHLSCGEIVIEGNIILKNPKYLHKNNSIQFNSILNFIVLTQQLEGPISEQHESKYKRTITISDKNIHKLVSLIRRGRASS
jgi:hypothetical protein